MHTKNAPVLGILVMLICGVSVDGLAASRDEQREQTALQGARLGLCQAIAAAERKTGGKAYDAGVDASHGTPRIIVETNGPKGVQTIVVDAQTGKIVSAHAGGEVD